MGAAAGAAGAVGWADVVGGGVIDGVVVGAVVLGGVVLGGVVLGVPTAPADSFVTRAPVLRSTSPPVPRVRVTGVVRPRRVVSCAVAARRVVSCRARVVSVARVVVGGCAPPLEAVPTASAMAAATSASRGTIVGWIVGIMPS
jgi:hypothetical protein